MRFFVPFTKVEKLDDGRLLVAGRATDETVDSQGDVLAYEGTKKAVKSWRGNVREQHDSKKAVGRALNIEFNDADRAVDVETFISSGAQDTQAKILEKVLTGFSVGGSAPKKFRMEKRDGQEIRVIEDWEMNELSVVDAPANPNANITLVKADGMATDVIAEAVEVAVAAAENRFAAKLIEAVEKAAATPEPEPAPAPEPVAAVETPAAEAVPVVEEEKAKKACDKCNKVHKDGVEACEAVAAAVTPEMTKKDALAAQKAELKKHFGGGEEYDIADALMILEYCKGLRAAETAEAGEGENESAQLGQLDACIKAIKDFIAAEAGELAAAAPVEMAAKPEVTKSELAAAFEAQRTALLDGVREIVKGEPKFTTENALDLAEGVGMGLAKANDPILKALGDLKALRGEVKAMSEAMEKFAKAPSPVKPLVRVPTGQGGTPPTASSGASRAAILRDYIAGASPETAAYLTQMAKAAERS